MNKYSPLLFVMAFSFLFGDTNVQIRLQNGQKAQGEFVGTYMNHVHILVEEKIIYYACDDIISITYSSSGWNYGKGYDYDCSKYTVTADILFPPELDPMTGEMAQILPDVFKPDIPKHVAKVEVGVLSTEQDFVVIDGVKYARVSPEKEVMELIKDQNYPDSLASPSHPKVDSEEKLPDSKPPYTWSGGMSFGFQSEKTPVSLLNGYLLFRLNEHQEIFTGFGTIIFFGSLFTGYKHYLNDFSKPSPYMSISYHGGSYFDSGGELTGIFPSLGYSKPISEETIKNIYYYTGFLDGLPPVKYGFLNIGIGYVFMQKNTMLDFEGKKGFLAPFLNLSFSFN